MSRHAHTKGEHKREKQLTPAEMKAVVIEEFGAPSVLERRDVPVPRPGPREVLIALHAAGVGIWDAKVRDGSWAEEDIDSPKIIGVDGAGVLAEVGERVRRLSVGDQVWAYQFDNPKGGFYAEYVVADMDHVAPLPSRLTMQEGGAGAVTGLTALQGCVDHLELRRGETVMIFGASGAVGTLAVQFAAQYRRARVIAIASGRDAQRLLEKLGAETVIDGRRRDAVDRIKEAAPDGLDAILALAGSPVLNASIDLVNTRGRVAFPNGVEPAPRRRKRLRVLGYDADASPTAFARLAHAVDAAELTVPIAKSFPLARAAQAHARVERGHVVGRVVLKIR